jgi:hypothetical protein
MGGERVGALEQGVGGKIMIVAARIRFPVNVSIH